MTSIEAVLKKLEPELIGIQFDALELLDRNADAKTFHETSFASDTPPFPDGLRFCSMRTGQQGEQQAAQDRQQFAAIEVVAVCCLKENGG